MSGEQTKSDGSPLIDIKPYNPSYHAAEYAKVAGWIGQIHREIVRGKC